MKTETIELFSEGERLGGIVQLPDAGSDAPLPVIIQPPGFLGLADGPVSTMYHERFTAAGFAVVSADYRGFGRSEGTAGWIHPGRQLEDLFNVVTWVTTQDHRFDVRRMFCYGHGGTGGGNAIMLTAADDRIRAVAAQTPVGDGAAWLRSMRRESEWQSYLRRLEDNDRRRVLEGAGEVVNPREDIMVATPERRREQSRAYADKKVGEGFQLASASHILRYRPLDHVASIAPRPVLLVSLEGDVVTPPDVGAAVLYAAAGEPKKLIRQAGVSHYDAYRANLDVVSDEVVAWFSSAPPLCDIEFETATPEKGLAA